MSYESGDLDLAEITGDQVDQVSDDPDLHIFSGISMWYLSPNISKVPELANLNIRKALTMAIDREVITSDVMKDGSVPTYTAVPPQFTSGPDGSDFSADQDRFSDDCKYDPQSAAEYWSAGLKELGISELSLELTCDADDAPQKVAVVIQDQLQKNLPGLTISITPEPKKQRIQDLANGDYQLGLTTWGPDYADPMTYLGLWVTGNSNNSGKWSDETYDSIIEACSTGEYAMDAKTRWEKLYDAEQIIMDNAVIFPIFTRSRAELISSSVQNIQFHTVPLLVVYKDATKASS